MNNMKKKLVLFASVAIALASCQTTPKEDYSWIKKGLDVASAQLQLTQQPQFTFPVSTSINVEICLMQK